MILGDYDVPSLGRCELERHKTEFNPKGILAFRLMGRETGEEIGKFGLSCKAGKEEVPGEPLKLTSVGITPGFRGRGGGSFLVGKALEYARGLRAPSFSAWAFNERVVSSIRTNLEPNEGLSVRILNFPDGLDREASADEAIRYLQEQREKSFSAEDDPDGSRMLGGIALPVYLEVPLL